MYIIYMYIKHTFTHTHEHTHTVSNTSAGCEGGDVRVVNGSVSNEGLVELCLNGRWGAICGDAWDAVDATVLCTQLGFPGNSEYCVCEW